MLKKAWEIEREIRLKAVPLDRRIHPSQWTTHVKSFSEDNQVARYWLNHVPGSGAPDSLYVGMVQSMANKGYDMTAAEELLPIGLALAEHKDFSELRALTAKLMERTFNAPLDKHSLYQQFHHPPDWESIVSAMSAEITREPMLRKPQDLDEKIYNGWLGQLAGGSFGTVLEGYSGTQLAQVYGNIEAYITQPETINDDVVYELALLDAFEKNGREITSGDIAMQWVRQIPYGYSAEWVALQNIKNGIFPPESGSFRNPYSDWIGAQMRGMVCGMLAPGWPFEAARLAYQDAVISHSANGAYGEMYAAVMTALAFSTSDIRKIIKTGLEYLPQGSEYAAIVRETLKVVRKHTIASHAWRILDERFKEYNWIHAYPNIAADLLALWYGEGDITHSFSLLAQAGLDVDCNAGLVGNILGVINIVPSQWTEPLGDVLETYLPGKERLSIRKLASHTTALSLQA
jgi:ADP-ribosylglycohydrolase